MARPAVGHGEREEIYADSAEKFKTVLSRIRSAPRGIVAVDTEFVGFPQYRPRLALVQLATEDMIAAVDPLSVPPEAIKELVRLLCLPDPSELTFERDTSTSDAAAHDGLELILHANSMDMMVFYDALDVEGGVPSASLAAPFGARMTSRIFDTQVAAAFGGYGGMVGLGPLIESVFAMTLDKSEQASNWLRRPLSESQISYALNDVRYLIELRDRLVAQLGEQKMEWLRGELEPLHELDCHAPPDPLHAWRNVRRWQRQEPRQQAVLRELTAWRERAGRAGNRAPLLLVNDNTLGDLSKAMPTTAEDLERCVADVNLKQFTARNHGDAILAAVRRGLEVRDEDLSATLAWPPRRGDGAGDSAGDGAFVPNSFMNERMIPMMGHLLTEQQSAVFHLTMCHIHSVAAKHGIAGELLARRDEMQRFAQTVVERASAAQEARDAEEKEDAAVIVSPPLPDYPLPIMQSWRYDVAGKGLEAVLEGGAALQLNGATFEIERRSS